MSNAKTRCKMKCSEILENEGNGFSYKLYPVISDEENSENSKFFKYTPSGVLELQCTNDQNLKVGKEYYIDISEAPTE